jgi:RNA polymerase sigma factor (sigma-70 family)
MELLSDSKLMLQIKDGSNQAFDVLFERYWEKMYQAAWVRLNDDAAAQDIVQEIFIKIWQRRETVSIQQSVEHYLLSAVRLSVISHFRSLKVTERRLQDALQRVELLENSIHDQADYLELEKTLEAAVNNMPEMLQQVYLLRCQNQSVKAIAGELGLAEQTVKNYISEVTRRLRQTIVKKHPEQHMTFVLLVLAMLYN